LRKNYNKGIYLILLLLIILPLFLGNYKLQLAIMSGVFILLTLSLNLMCGYTGQFSFGHAGFYAIGAYTSAILATRYNLPFLIGLIGAFVMSGIVGLVIGLPCLRTKSIYLSVMTIGFGMIVNLLANNLDFLTGGTSGIMKIPRPNLFRTDLSYYYIVLAAVVIIIYFTNEIINSKFGRALISIREDELAASTMGINITYYKVFSFVLSASIAGVAGALYAHFARFICPDSFTMHTSIKILVMVVLGGLGSIWGSVIGAIIGSLLPEMLRSMQNYYYFAYGIMLILLLLFFPDGLISVINNFTCEGKLIYDFTCR